MNRIYYVSEFFQLAVKTGDLIPEGVVYHTYDQALEAFNSVLNENGKQLVKQPKGEKVLSVYLGKSYLQLWFITNCDYLTPTEKIDQ